MKKILGLSTLVLMTACAGEGEPVNEENTDVEESTAGNENNEAVEETDPDALVINMNADVTSLDPHFGNDHYSLNVKRTIYDTLVATDENLDLEMSLAESFEQIDDTTWEVVLQEGITFHDGADFNAETVKMNIERMLDPDLASPVAFMFDMIEEVEVTDEYSLQIHTEYPFAPLRIHFAHPAGQQISPLVIEEDYEAMEEGEDPGSVVNETPTGTGFYQMEEQDPGEAYRLIQNEGYWRGEPGAENLTFEIVPEDLTRVGQLETNAAQIIGHLNPNDVSRVDENEETKVARFDSASLAYLGFQTQEEPFDDPLVRVAIAKAVNKEDIVESVMAGTALPAVGPLAPPVFGSSEELDVIEEDIEEAQELLAEAGYEDGFDVELWVDDSRAWLDAAEIIQAQLAPIGVNVEIESMESGVHRERLTDGDAPMFISSWGTVTGDADYGLYPVFHSDSHGVSGNRTFYENEEVDELLEAARQESDEATREELYHEAQQIIVDEAPMVPLYHIEHLVGLQEDIENFVIHPSSLYDMFPVERAE